MGGKPVGGHRLTCRLAPARIVADAAVTFTERPGHKGRGAGTEAHARDEGKAFGVGKGA